MNMIEKKMTTKEVAESLGCTVKTVLENAKKWEYSQWEREVDENNFNFYKRFAPWISDEQAWYWTRNPRHDENGITLADDMGLLYIATDTSHPGEYKIGKTNCNDPFRRELHTTSPRYKMLYMSVSRSVAEDEKKVHKWCKDILKAHIKFDHAKEWFRLDDDYLQFIIDKFDFVKAERPKEYIKWGGEMD